MQLERTHTAAEGYGKAIKEVFCHWTSAINYNSLLGTVFLAHSVGSESGLCLGATSCKQTEGGGEKEKERDGQSERDGCCYHEYAWQPTKIVAQVL